MIVNIAPLKSGAISIKKSELLKNRTLLGIDSGSSMTKVIFLHKSNKGQFEDENMDMVTLNHALFNNQDFAEAMRWTKEESYMWQEKTYSVHITGNMARSNMTLLESLFGVPIEYVDEMLTIAAGHRIALEYIGLENLLSPAVEHEELGKVENYIFEKFAEGLSSQYPAISTATFPCLIHVYGSLSGFFFFDENGVGEFSSCLLTGGKSFMGLAKCLLDTNNYDEIVALASKGDLANIDTQVKDIFSDAHNSTYGKFPPEMPLFAFGKCADFNKGCEEMSREDLALSLVGFFAFMMIVECGQVCLMRKIPKVYLTGNIFRSNLFKKEISRILSVFPFVVHFEVLDFGYFGALGAIFCGNEEKEKYYKE